MNRNRWRSVLAGTCGTLGVTALVLGLLLGYATRAVFNSRAFSARLAASLSEPGVSNYVAGRIADGVIAAKPDLTGLRPLIIAGSRSVVASAPFRVAAERAALEAHRALMSGAAEKVILSVHDVGEILKATLSMHPDMASKLPRRLSARLAGLDELPTGVLAARLVRAGHRARAGYVVLMFAGLVLTGCAVGLSRDSRRAMFRVGVSLASAACAVWLVARFGGIVLAALPGDRDMGQLAAGLWQAFVGDLRLRALALGLVGLVLASASGSLERHARTAEQLRSAWTRLATTPERRWHQFLRGLAFLALGVSAVVWPMPVLGVAALLAGGVGAFFGLRECFSVILRTIPEVERRLDAAGGRKAAGGWGPLRTTAAGVLVAVAMAAAWIWIVRTPSGPAGPPLITACNGYAELCDRRLDRVVFPTTHNAMGGADNPGWMFPNQSYSIPRQLEDGVRAFMIDAHYGIPVGDKVKTVLENEKAAMAKYEAVVGKEGAEAALRIRDRLVGGDEKDRAVFMGHGFCELGATSLTETLGRMRDFLVANPGEIIVIIIQDEGVTPQDIAKCFDESGLLDFVYRGPVTPPWPTLRQMAESNQRVVVLAENNSAGVPWYHRAFEVIQETPYTFHEPSQFSENPNRGGTGGSLLLMNHWIESTPMPKPSNAEVVNAHDFLLKRAKRCERVRGRVVNFVAVDFYATGDLMRVCRALNGIRR
jgi:hypothetical protein